MIRQGQSNLNQQKAIIHSNNSQEKHVNSKFSIKKSDIKSQSHAQNEKNQRDSKGILSYPPNHITNKYTFHNQSEQSKAGWCGFCPRLDRYQSQIYISPSQVISRNQFQKQSKFFCCLPQYPNY